MAIFRKAFFQKVKKLDKLGAVKVLIAAVDAGSLTGAASRLGRSAAAITRTIAFLEEELGVVLLHRTTRSIRLSETGERYVAACRRILADLEDADLMAAGHRPRHGGC